MPVCPSRWFCTCLMRPSMPICAGHGVDARRVEGCRQADRLGIFRHALVDYAMQSLAPPLVRGNLEPRNGGRVVLHLRRFFRQRHAMHQVGGPLLWGQLRIQVREIFGFLSNCVCSDEANRSAPLQAAMPSMILVMLVFILLLQMSLSNYCASGDLKTSAAN